MIEQKAGSEVFRLTQKVRGNSTEHKVTARASGRKLLDLAFGEQLSSAVVSSRLTRSIIRSEAAIRSVSPLINDLLKQTGQADDITLLPEYFLKNNALRCAPVLLLIREDEQIVAALYGRERKMLGVRTGMVQFGDYYGEGAVIAKEHFKATALGLAALNVLKLPWIHSVRASLKVRDQNELATIEGMTDGAKVKSRSLPETLQHVLPLKETFDGFLTTLGSHTRRNLRVYRRRVEQKGWKFVPRLTQQEAAAALQVLEQQQGKHKSSPHYLECCQATLNAVPGSFYAGICTDAGEWVSLAAGWLRNDQYFMLVQLNDARHSRDSISTVMRSYLIEDLIGSGVKVINFVGGCSELLRNFCTPQPCVHYLFEKKGLLSMAREFVAPRLFKHSMVSRIVRGDLEVPKEEPTPA